MTKRIETRTSLKRAHSERRRDQQFGGDELSSRRQRKRAKAETSVGPGCHQHQSKAVQVGQGFGEIFASKRPLPCSLSAYFRGGTMENVLQLEKLTAALSGQARSNMVALNMNSRLLLENYGGFLPRQGHAYAEQMKEAAADMERLRQDLVGSPSSNGNGRAA